MNKAVATGVALLVLFFAAPGAIAQEAQDDTSQSLLEVLRDRQIISAQEYDELRSLEDTNLIDQAIDQYLVECGDVRGANVSSRKHDGLFETYAKSPAAAASRIRVHSKRLDRYPGIGIDSVLLAFAEDKPAAADAAPASGSAAPSHGNLASAVMLMIAVTSAPTPID